MSVNHLTTNVPTSLGNWALLLAKTVESYDVDSQLLFKDCGVDLASIKKSNGRFPTAFMVKLWNLAVNRTGDPYIALRAAKYFNTTTFGGLGLAIAASHHAYDALQRCTRYGRFISEDCSTHLQDGEKQVGLIVHSELADDTHIYGFSAAFCCLYKIFIELTGGKLKLREIHFCGSLDSKLALQDYFGCAVYYRSNCNKMVFDKETLFQEQDFTNASLANSLDDWVENYLNRNQPELVSAQVEKYLLKNLVNGELDQGKVASSLAMSTRLLQRRLKREGTVYSQIFDDCRKKLAIQLMHGQTLPMSEVAFMLGFSDQGNFSRAFKRWTGSPPYQYRS